MRQNRVKILKEIYDRCADNKNNFTKSADLKLYETEIDTLEYAINGLKSIGVIKEILVEHYNVTNNSNYDWYEIIDKIYEEEIEDDYLKGFCRAMLFINDICEEADL